MSERVRESPAESQRGRWSRGVYLEVSVDDEAVVHVLQSQDDFSRIETHLLLTEHAVLRQVVVQVAP